MSKASFFAWMDDEVELLLRVTSEYKSQKALESVDWETCVTKYGDILRRFVSEYPFSTVREDKDFPHKEEEITKSALTTKLKAIRIKYRQAVDAGKRSGHGRVVLLFFDACERMWGGSPASQQLNDSVETADLADPQPDYMESESPESHDDGGTQDGMTAACRDKLATQLLTYRTDRLKRKLNKDDKMAAIAQEDIKLKKQMVQKMEESEREFSATLNKLSDSIDRLTSSMSACMADGFELMRQAMFQPPPPNYPHYHFSHPHPSMSSPPTPTPLNSNQQQHPFSISQYFPPPPPIAYTFFLHFLWPVLIVRLQLFCCSCCLLLKPSVPNTVMSLMLVFIESFRVNSTRGSHDKTLILF
ncbi:hypothetical protein ACEWY4_007785 [Coilia grayii]|uniref:Uncharacterized protein n=1 Tax=Coilia grayii TaxID=363190 RepID=A0ABD1K913_9TELE